MWTGTNQYWIHRTSLKKKLEIPNIEPGSLYERHAKAMDKKVFLWQTTKRKKEIQEKA